MAKEYRRSFLSIVRDVENDFLLADYATLAYTGGLTHTGVKKMALARYVAKQFINYVQTASYVRTRKKKFVAQNYRVANPYDLAILWNDSLPHEKPTTKGGMEQKIQEVSATLYRIFTGFDIPKIFNTLEIDEDEVVRLSNWLDIIKDEPTLSVRFANEIPYQVQREFDKVDKATLSYSIEELEKSGAVDYYKGLFPSDIYALEEDKPELFKQLAYINTLVTRSVVANYDAFMREDETVYGKKIYLLRQLSDLSVDKVVYRKQDTVPIMIDYSEDDSGLYKKPRAELENTIKTQSVIIDGLHLQIQNRDEALKTATAPANATIKEQQEEINKLKATIESLHNENIELEQQINKLGSTKQERVDTSEDVVGLKDVYGFSDTKAIEEILLEATEEDFGDFERRNAMPTFDDYAEKFADRLEKLYSAESLLKFLNGVNPKVVKKGLEILKERAKENA